MVEGATLKQIITEFQYESSLLDQSKKNFGAHSKKIFFNASGTSTNELANTENKSTDSPSQTNLLDMCQISKMAKDLGIFIFNLI